MRICILETDRPGEALTARHGTYADMFVRWLAPALPGATFDRIHVSGGEALPDPAAHDGYLITGSRNGVYEALPWMAPLMDFLRAAAAQRVPTAGICFGHQILAAAHGGTVQKYQGGMVLGRIAHEIAPEARDLFEGAETLAALSIHQDQVTQLPPGARVIVSTPASPHSGLAYPFPAMSVQFHPELDAGMVRALVAPGSGVTLPEGLWEAAEPDLDAPLDNARTARAFARFFVEKAGRR